MNAAAPAVVVSPRAGSDALAWLAAGVVAMMVWRFWLVAHLGITLQVDEAQYWDWSRELAWGYYSKPPVVAALISASTAVAGDSVFGVKWLAMLLYPLTALVLAQLAREMAGQRPALWAAALMMSAPMCGLLGMFATTDAPLMLAWSLAAWALWRALHSGSAVHWALLGGALALGLLSKYTMGAFVLTVALLLLRERDSALWSSHRRGVVLAVAVVSLALLPHLVWNQAHGWPTWRHTAEITAGAARHGSSSALVAWAEFTLAQVLMVGVVPMALVAVALRRRDRERRNDNQRAADTFATCLALPLLVIGMLQALQSRAQINWAAPALLGVMLWLSLRANSFSRGALVIAIASNLLLTAVVAHAPDLARTLNRSLPQSLDAWSRMRGWDVAFDRLRPAAAGLAATQSETLLIGSNRTVLAQAAYQWRDLRLRGVAWNPSQHRNDHYELTTHLPEANDPAAQQPMLFLSDVADAGGALSAFLNVTPAGSAEVRAGDRRVVRLFLWQVQGLILRRTP